MAKHIEIQQVKGSTFAAKGDSGHWVIMDAPKEIGGSSAGSSPMEMILMGLGGCTSMDVLSILVKMKEDVLDYKVEIFAENAEEHPKIYTKIKIKYYFYGNNLNGKNIEKAIRLSQDKYCSVSAMLKKSSEIDFSYEIIQV